MGYKKTIYKRVCKAGLVLTLISLYGTTTLNVSAEEGIKGEAVEELVVDGKAEDSKVLLRDQTFTLGRLKLDAGTEYDYLETIPNRGLTGLATESKEVIKPLGEGYEGYVGIKGRIKSGDKVWLEVEVGGEHAGYITQGRLEVKPLVRTKSIGIPHGLDTSIVTEEPVHLYGNISFINTGVEELASGEELTIIGLHETTFYRNPVESYEVTTSDGRTGWVKGSDITRLTEEELEEFNKEQFKELEAELEEAELEEAEIEEAEPEAGVSVIVGVSGVGVTEVEEDSTEYARVKSGTVFYDKPTYLEEAEVITSSAQELDIAVVDTVKDEGVKNYFYKVYTKDGKEGYVSVNEHINNNETEYVSSEELAGENVQVMVEDVKVAQNLPAGLSGARDTHVVEAGIPYQVINKTTVEDEEGNQIEYYLLHNDLVSELEGTEDSEGLEDNDSLEEAEVVSEDDNEGNEESELYPEGFVGYVNVKDTVSLEEVEEGDTEAEEGNVTTNSDTDDSEETQDGEEAETNPRDKDSEMEELLKGWVVGGATYEAPEYNVPSSASSGTTVEFIKTLTPYTLQVKEGGLYPSVMMAQAILESSSGRSGLARQSNNLFGVKGSYKGQSRSYSTQEADGVQFYSTDAGFRVYPSYKESIEDYVQLLNNANYTRNGVVNASSSFNSLVGLKKAGYATDPLYVPKVWRIIDSYNLTQFD